MTSNTQGDTPPIQPDREALARKVFELMTHGGQLEDGEYLVEDSRSYAIADFILSWHNQALERERLEATRTALEKPNDLLRSAAQIAKRNGAETNWPVFRGKLKTELEREHKIMYPRSTNDATLTNKDKDNE